MDIHIKKFKKIDDATVNLQQINIFIGANNSGKSSFIQGIQFAISGCQTLNLSGGVWAKKSTKTLSLDASEFLYTPTQSIEYLYYGKKLTGSKTKKTRSWIEFNFSDGHTASLKISKGKNGGFTTVLTGKTLGDTLSNIESPYCVYVPGIAGIPTREKYEVPITIKKSATRGDSNNFLRNILYAISQDILKWESFQGSVNKIYNDIDVRVGFDHNKSEFISVYVFNGGIELPLDSVGTGLLQVIQVFAYIEYFTPRLILLDEPDSHIHPTKQKLLANELASRTYVDKELKVVFSTHSRYILSALEGKANVVHFQNGKAINDVSESQILIDIGAADADYLFSKKSLKYIIVTEDKVDNIENKKEYLKKFLLANLLKEDEFVLHSYEGCSKVDFARILKGFVNKQIPTAEIILHVDRDQRIDSDRDLIKLRSDCEKKGIVLFVTKYQEIESYFCTPAHIHNIYGIPLELASRKYAELIFELKEETIRKLKNFILRDREELGINKDGKIEISKVEALAAEWYDKYGEILTPGKELLGKVKSFIQDELKLQPQDILEPSEALRDYEFISLIF